MCLPPVPFAVSLFLSHAFATSRSFTALCTPLRCIRSSLPVHLSTTCAHATRSTHTYARTHTTGCTGGMLCAVVRRCRLNSRRRLELYSAFYSPLAVLLIFILLLICSNKNLHTTIDAKSRYSQNALYFTLYGAASLRTQLKSATIRCNCCFICRAKLIRIIANN